MIILSRNIHYEVRQRVHKKLTIFNQNNMGLLYTIMYKQKGKVSSFLTLKISCEQPSSHIGMGSSPLTRQCHEEHNDTHCDLF